MSVINQMLKDLEERAPEQGQVAMPVAVSNKSSTMKIVVVSVVVLVCLNLLGLYIWDLQEQIQQQTKPLVSSSEIKAKEQKQEPVKRQVRVSSGELTEEKQEQVTILQQVKPRVSSDELTVKKQKQVAIPQQIKPRVLSDELIVKKQEQLAIPQQTKPRVSSSELRTRAKEENKIAQVTPSKMTVSRREMTPKELVSQKLARAEKAIRNNDIIKAEAFFEEVLIIQPNHKEARKKLAALWFGKKSYQQATNLLSQGISLDSNDAELRMLKARIHQQQGQIQAAYNTLKPLALVKNQEYQVTLANVSQQIARYKSAIQAYKILIDMQEYSGRWHLGLAIIYDKSSQFSLAAAEYKLALTKPDLSIASAEFAQQRIQALGE